MAFSNNVFINCPFDKEYYLLLRPLIYTLLYNGFNPRIAIEDSDSGQLKSPKAKRNYVKYRSVNPLQPLQVLEMDIKFQWLNEHRRFAFIIYFNRLFYPVCAGLAGGLFH